MSVPFNSGTADNAIRMIAAAQGRMVFGVSILFFEVFPRKKRQIAVEDDKAAAARYTVTGKIPPPRVVSNIITHARMVYGKKTLNCI